jgi:hypothetical protein
MKRATKRGDLATIAFPEEMFRVMPVIWLKNQFFNGFSTAYV